MSTGEVLPDDGNNESQTYPLLTKGEYHMKYDNKDYWSKWDLKEKRDWTETGIRKFLVSPDGHDHFGKYGKARGLYLKSRVLQVELSQGYQNWKMKNENRKNGSRKAIITKAANLMKEIESCVIDIQLMEEDLLIDAAKKHWVTEAQRAGAYFKASAVENVDHSYLMVNYLRHQALCNEFMFRSLYRRVGRRTAITRLSKRVCQMIAEMYPKLSQEAENQKAMIMDCQRRDEDVE